MSAPRRALAAILMIAASMLAACSSTTTVEVPPAAGTTAASKTASSRPTSAPAQTTPRSPVAPDVSVSGRAKAQSGSSGLPTVALTDLPLEAQQTYALIAAGGPYPYRQDGQIFGNREGLLPWGDYGWYREYTVETPGSADRGARRFVVSEDRLFYYTDDHYDTFREVIR